MDNEELSCEKYILNKNEILNKILDYNKPEGWDKIHNLVHYFVCIKYPQKSEEQNNYSDRPNTV